MTFDLEKARAETEHLRENIEEEFSCMCGVCHACGFNPEEMKEALDEIERLRSGHCADCCCARSWEALGITEYTGKSIPEEIAHLREWMIKNRDTATELQYQLDEATARIQVLEALRSDILEAIRRPKTTSDKGLILYLKELDEYNIRAAKRVGDLEDALAEYQRLGKTISEVVVPCLTAHGNCDQCRPKAKAACDAIETIRKGKIGSGDHIGEPNKLIGPDAKPRSWQITDERVEALKVATGEMDLSENIFYLNSLKTMLEEAGQ